MSICVSVFHKCIFYLAFYFSFNFKRLNFLSCFLWSAQRGVILSLLPGQFKCDLEMFKLKNSKVPLCPPLPNLQVALQPQPGTEMVRLGLKRPLKPQARQVHPLNLKLTRGTLTTLVVGLVSLASWDWSQFSCQFSWLPASLHEKCACVTVWSKRWPSIKLSEPANQWNRLLSIVFFWSLRDFHSTEESRSVRLCNSVF